MQSQRSRRTQQLAKSSRESDAAQRPAESGSSSGEPDFISRRRPGSSDSAGPSLSQIRPLTIQVNHTDGAPIIAKKIVINERKLVAFRRETQIADPSGSLIKYLANGVLDPALAVHNVDHGQSFSTRNPVCGFNIVQQIAWSIGADRNLGQSTAMSEMIGTDAEPPQHCDLATGRYR